ncbi:MAG: hypothetical protein IKI97_02255 [Clostridia bacterium]|nr:hypothetical protein [Clostridia bacterium]
MNLREKTENTIFNSGVMLLLFLISTLLFNSAAFLVGLSVKPVFLPLCLLFSACLYFYLLKKKDTRISINGFVLGLAVLVFFVVLSNNIYDMSFDGNWYHKASVGSLKYGWNPIYSSLADFAAMPGGVGIGNLAESAIWADHYCKAPWIVGANIYSFTGSIECAKAVNLIFAYILFSFLYRYLSKKGFSVLSSTILSVITALNPISVSQMFTFYNDGLLASAVFTLIVLLCDLSDRENDEDMSLQTVLLFSAVVFCISIKFTGLVYAAFFCFAFYVLWLVRAYKKGDFKKVLAKASAFYTVTVLVAVLFVGSSSYVKNTIEHKNPLYPLFGEESVDIMTLNQPAAFSGMSGIERLFYSIFSETSNLMGEGELRLKRPFEVLPEEIKLTATSPDTRIGGMGPLFGGILCISLPVLVIAAVYLALKNRRCFFNALSVFLPSTLLILIIKESWWARYSPFLWLVPVAALAFVFCCIRKINLYAKVPVLLFAVFLLFTSVTNVGFFALYPKMALDRTSDIKDNFTCLSVISRDSNVKIAFATYAFYGIEYNLKDNGINYTIVAQIEGDGLDIYDGKATAQVDFILE